MLVQLFSGMPLLNNCAGDPGKCKGNSVPENCTRQNTIFKLDKMNSAPACYFH